MADSIVNAVIDHIPLWVYIVVGVLAIGVLFYFFSPILIPIWNVLPEWLKAVILGIGAATLAYLGGRYKGNKDERDAEAARDAEALNKRKEVDNAIDKQSPQQTDKALDPWRRD